MSQLRRLLASWVGIAVVALAAASSAWACLTEYDIEMRAALQVQTCPSAAEARAVEGDLSEHSRFGKAEFVVLGERGYQILCVYWGDLLAFWEENHSFEIAPTGVWPSAADRTFGPTEDLTGDGRPNVVVLATTGGAHCCYEYLILSLERDKIRCLDIVGRGDYEVSFEPFPDELGFAMIERENVFAYWRAAFAESPAPDVIMRFRGGMYRADAELMRARPPSAEEVRRLAAEVRASPVWKTRLEPQLWKVMLDLMYTGNADVAREFFEAAWPEGRTGKEEFAQEFWECQLRHSIYWTTIKELNGLSGHEPEGDCPGYQ